MRPRGANRWCARNGTTGERWDYMSRTNPPASATEQDVRNKIEAHQVNNASPGYSSERLFIAFTKGVSFSGYNTTWCAYHGSWGGVILRDLPTIDRPLRW